MNNFFSGLERLGFKDLDKVDLYKKDEDETNQNEVKKQKLQVDPINFLYLKTYHCPVCSNEFKEKTVKVGKSRRVSMDTDLMPRYDKINSLFYEVVICPTCGYSALIKYFDKLKSDQVELIREKISSNFKPKVYPDLFDLDIAIERFKLTLLNALVKQARTSEKAFICLKLSWLYRLKEDPANETKFMEQAYIGFNESFSTEPFPICGMDMYTLMYLIGELARRLEKYDEALQWLSRVITGKNVNTRLKELARDQKDLIKEAK